MPECQIELEYLKTCLTSDPILKPIGLNRDLVISCDVSTYGIGFVIMQADDDGLLLICHHTCQGQLLSRGPIAVTVMYALKSIEWLVQCRHVTIITDNTAVLHIQEWNPRNRRQRRMLTYVMQFNLTICYIHGSSNTIPDSLSRLFKDSSPQERQENEAKYMHEVDDFILPVTTRFQNRASLGQTPDMAPIERAVQQQSSPQPPLQREQTLHTRVRDDTKLPAAVQSAGGNRKTPTEISGMDSPCDVQQQHTPVHTSIRDDSILPDVAQSSRSGTKTPLDMAIMDPPGPSQQAHTAPVPAGDAEALWSDTLHAHDITLVPLLNTTRNNDNSDLLIRHDGIVDPNSVQSENKVLSEVPFPVISSADFETDAEFSGMFLYLQDGALSGNVKKDKPILIMEDKYIIDEDGLLYRVDIPRQKNLARLKPVTKRLCVPLKFRHDMISYVHDNCGHYAAQSVFHTLAARYFWKSMFADAVEYCRTSDTCQRTKINYGHRYAPLHILSVPEELGT